jgi:hypothetical protein
MRRRTGIHGWRHLLRFRHFCVPRQGFSSTDCLDASAGDLQSGRFAIADGASEGGPDSGRWARLLVDDFVRTEGTQESWPTSLLSLQARWRAEVGQTAAPIDVPWYVVEHARSRDNDAFATFLGLTMHAATAPETPWRWQALAVGDSCLFQVRTGVLVERFPMTAYEEFTTTPWLVGSHTTPEEVRRDRSRTCAGESGPDDILWLMTDALAEWFLLRWQVDEKPWEELEPFLNPMVVDESFDDWIAELRRTAQIRNDDVTLAAVWLE